MKRKSCLFSPLPQPQRPPPRPPARCRRTLQSPPLPSRPGHVFVFHIAFRSLCLDSELCRAAQVAVAASRWWRYFVNTTTNSITQFCALLFFCLPSTCAGLWPGSAGVECLGRPLVDCVRIALCCPYIPLAGAGRQAPRPSR
jgi:hypothetical protein